MIARRTALRQLLAWGAFNSVAHSQDLTRAVPGAPPPLNAVQSATFRAWFSAIVLDQIRRTPSPRWTHRDCAGLVRFAAREALAVHDAKWFKVMGWPTDRPWPNEVVTHADQTKIGQVWAQSDGTWAAFASALALVQNNTVALGKNATRMQSADLLFFDQGAEQHLMVWTGQLIAYHNGSEPSAEDNGLRTTSLPHLLRHPDTRWRPNSGNANFAGWYRFRFLTPSS